MPRLAIHPGSRPRRAESALTEQAVELQADLAELERDAAPMWDTARRTRRPAFVDQVRLIAKLIRAAHLRARALAGAADQADEAIAA